MGHRIVVTEKGHALRKEIFKEITRESSRTPSPISKMTPLTNNPSGTSFRSKSPGPTIATLYTPRIKNKSVEPSRHLDRLYGMHEKIQQKQQRIVDDIRKKSLWL